METGKRETGNVHAHTRPPRVFGFSRGESWVGKMEREGGGRGITVGKSERIERGT